jgi:imidazolonepropionase-like amidohydrolase
MTSPTAPGRVFYRPRAMFDGIDKQLRAGDGLLVGNGTVLAVGSPAELVGSDVTVRDLGDVVLVPGFVDAHTHITIRPGEGDQHGQLARPPAWQTIRGVENLRRMLRSGVTTAKIMTEHHDIDYEFRDAIARGEIAGPRLLVAGPGISPPGGHGAGGHGVSGVDGLREAVRARAARGADHIKIFTTGGVSSENSALGESNYSSEEIGAIIGEANKAGLKVSSHAHGGAGVDLAVANGIHSIEHGSLLDENNLAAMVASNTWLVMTHTILFHPTGIEQGDARSPHIIAKVHQARAYVEQNVNRVRGSGIRIALGTDSMHGLFGYEMQWLVEHGWRERDALVAATRHGGELIGDPTVGVLRPGSRADFVVLRGDPLADIRAVFDVAAVFRAGKQVVDGEQVLDPIATAGPSAVGIDSGLDEVVAAGTIA